MVHSYKPYQIVGTSSINLYRRKSPLNVSTKKCHVHYCLMIKLVCCTMKSFILYIVECKANYIAYNYIINTDACSGGRGTFTPFVFKLNIFHIFNRKWHIFIDFFLSFENLLAPLEIDGHVCHGSMIIFFSGVQS